MKPTKGEYIYTKVKYIDCITDVEIFHPKCDRTFWQRPHSHLSGFGCSYCANKSNGEKKQLSREEFIKRAKLIHGKAYKYKKVKYQGRKKRLLLSARDARKILIRVQNIIFVDIIAQDAVYLLDTAN